MTTETHENEQLLHHLIHRLEGALTVEERPWAARDLRYAVALLHAVSDTLDTLDLSARFGSEMPATD